MTLFALKLQPGLHRQGTEYGSKGFYYDAYLVRWTPDGTLKPVSGWRPRSASIVSGKARAIISWRDNSSVTWIGIGTHSGLFIEDRTGDVFDITPAGFSVGRPDAEAVGGYGSGTYGSGAYGTARPDASAVQPATQWTLDTWGQDLVGVSPDDGKIYEWPLNTATPAAQVSNSPTCHALVVTPEGFLFALGTTDPRTVGWCDQHDDTTWAPDTTNQAGDYPLQTQGSLMCGKVVKGGTLLFTDLDVHLASYVGGNSVYGFDRVGTSCGVISRQCVAAIDAQAVWMGKNSFWLYNGYISPLACDVQDYVFSDFNTLQASKTYCVRDSVNSEVLFYYCSSASNEIDRCVVWNYQFNYWNIGRVARTCGTDRGVFTYPIFVDASGAVYEHEVGLDYAGATPYAEAGPIELGDGDTVMRCNQVIADEKTAGDVTASFRTKFYPNGDEQVFGPYTLGAKTDVRFETRQVKVRFIGAQLSDWRVGTLRLDVSKGGRR